MDVWNIFLSGSEPCGFLIIDQGKYKKALKKVKRRLAIVDGCANNGTPDKK